MLGTRDVGEDSMSMNMLDWIEQWLGMLLESVPQITTVELQKKLSQGSPYILVDVREPDEVKLEPFFLGSPEYYYAIPLQQLLVAPTTLLEKRFQMLGFRVLPPIVFLCRSGGRSARACRHFQKLGWQTLNLRGGRIAWGNPL